MGFFNWNPLETAKYAGNKVPSLTGTSESTGGWANFPDMLEPWAKKGKNLSQLMQDFSANTGFNYLSGLQGSNLGASNQAFSNLMQLLQSQGRTDPRLMNQQMAGIQRDTQGAQQQMQGGLQGRGFQNSGVGAALQAAMGQAGVGKQADVRAREAQDAEERRRQDLRLFQMLVGDPSIDSMALAMGQYNSDKNANTQKQAATAQGVGSLLQAFASMFGGS